MPVFHCPLCPLIFEYRTEVEHHLRNEHRSRAEEEAALTSELVTAAGDLTWVRLRELQNSRSGTAVSIFIATTPAPTMTSLDVARLRRLANQAQRRLAAEPGCVPATIETRLARAVAAAEGAATQEGVALLVNAHQLAILQLPFEPADRVVVDPTFATRELEITLQCYPRYRLVVLSSNPRLFEGRGLHLSEIDTETEVPTISPPHATHSRDGKRSAHPERWSIGRTRRQAGVRLVDQMIADRVRTAGELPLVVAGDGRWRSQFRRQSQQAPSIIGEIPGIRHRDPASRLAELAQPHLARKVQDQETAAMAELERSDSHASIVWGLEPTWVALQEGTAETLWIAKGYARPGRVTGDPPALTIVSDPNQPGVNDDLVDDLIKSAHNRGIPVHFLPDGKITHPEPIASRVRNVPATTPALQAAV